MWGSLQRYCSWRQQLLMRLPNVVAHRRGRVPIPTSALPLPTRMYPSIQQFLYILYIRFFRIADFAETKMLCFMAFTIEIGMRYFCEAFTERHRLRAFEPLSLHASCDHKCEYVMRMQWKHKQKQSQNDTELTPVRCYVLSAIICLIVFVSLLFSYCTLPISMDLIVLCSSRRYIYTWNSFVCLSFFAFLWNWSFSLFRSVQTN